MSLTTLLAIMKHMSRPKNAAVKVINIADILGNKHRHRIDISHGDIDLPLVHTLARNPISVFLQLCQRAKTRTQASIAQATTFTYLSN